MSEQPMTDRTLRSTTDLDTLAFDDRGLIPVVAQDESTGAVLMVAWANLDALVRTLDEGKMVFWSRSRGELWRKGDTSGNVLELVSLHTDCDADTIVARVRPTGPACHTGETTCFGDLGETGVEPESTLPEVWATLVSRAQERPEGSYTVRLIEDENLRIKKLGEEAAELIQALVKGENERAAEEAADLIYHTLAALLANGVTLGDVLKELEGRR